MNNWVKQYEQELNNKGLEAEFNFASDNLLTIEIIGVPKKFQGQGIGSEILNKLCDYADNNSIVLQLRPSSSATHSRSKLISYYSKFGFIENKGINKNDLYQYMYRLPKLKESFINKIILESRL